MKKQGAKASDIYLHVVVSGRVQGVGFRWSAAHEAQSLSLVGWIKNLASGDVEVYAEGPAELIQTFKEWLNAGPPGARVETLDAREGKAAGRFADFSIVE